MILILIGGSCRSFEYLGRQFGVCEWLCLGVGTKRKIGFEDETRMAFDSFLQS